MDPTIEMSSEENAGLSTVLEVACKFFQADANEDLYVAVNNASPAKLAAFLEHYRMAAHKGILKPPRLEANTLRPYLISDDVEPWNWGNFSFGFSSFKDADRVWSAVDAIKHRLLYCHSVAVDDPLAVFICGELDRDIQIKDVVDYRTHILNYINFILHMKPLIERKIFCLITDASPHEFRRPFISNLFRMFGPPFRDEPSDFQPLVLSKSEIDDFYRQAPSNVQAMWIGLPWGQNFGDGFLFASARVRILRILNTLARSPKSLSLYLPFRADIRMMAAFQDNIRRSLVRETLMPQVHDRDSRLLTQLVDMNVPGIADLPIEDIVAIREANVFASWRNDLKKALQDASSIPSDLIDYDSEARSAVLEMLEPAREKLEDEFKNSAFLARFREAAVTIACGSIGAFIGYAVDPSVGALIGGIAGSTADVATKLVRSWIETQKSGPTAARAAVISHYVALLS